MNDDFKLVLEVPNTDFDGIELELAIRWVRDMRALGALPPNVDWEDKGRHAAKILDIIAQRYNAALAGDAEVDPAVQVRR
jgi:hypothetical protein